MTRSINQVLWDQWRKRLERQRASGLSVVEFCRSEQVSPHRFHAWKRRLFPAKAKRRAPGTALRTQRLQQRQVIVTPPALAQLMSALPRSAEFLQLPVSAAQGSPWIELALADGTILRLPQQNLAALIAALRVLRGERVELPAGDGGHA